MNLWSGGPPPRGGAIAAPPPRPPPPPAGRPAPPAGRPAPPRPPAGPPAARAASPRRTRGPRAHARFPHDHGRPPPSFRLRRTRGPRAPRQPPCPRPPRTVHTCCGIGTRRQPPGGALRPAAPPARPPARPRLHPGHAQPPRDLGLHNLRKWEFCPLRSGIPAAGPQRASLAPGPPVPCAPPHRAGAAAPAAHPRQSPPDSLTPFSAAAGDAPRAGGEPAADSAPRRARRRTAFRPDRLWRFAQRRSQSPAVLTLPPGPFGLPAVRPFACGLPCSRKVRLQACRNRPVLPAG